VYAAPVDNEVEPHLRTVGACQAIRNYPRISEGIRRSTMRRVEQCTESHGRHLSTYNESTLSHITHKLKVSGHMLIGIFFLVLVVEILPKVFPHLSVTLCMKGISVL
jgi:hypothetical protein